MDLLLKKCIVCEGGRPPLNKRQIEKYLPKTPGWSASADFKKIGREFKFNDFNEAVKFINRVAELAESEGHHPDLHVFYNRVFIELWTHAINGLSENDFILAAKINTIKI